MSKEGAKEEKVANGEPAVASETPAPEPQPFSRWKCVLDPKEAQDPAQYRPYAVLDLVIDRAEGLVAADINGMSDPYVAISVNGATPEIKTEAKSWTLSPTWKESFQIPIYNPLTIVTLTVNDADFGTSLGNFDFLGLDDDFIGWVDLQLGKLPYNTPIEGWFDLGLEEDYDDSLAARRDSKISPCGGGRIYLKLELKADDPEDEFFALTLPPPHQGHGFPPLSLPSLFKNALELTELLQTVGKRAGAASDWFHHNIGMLFVVSLFFIWHPTLVLPGIASGMLALVVYKNQGMFLQVYNDLKRKMKGESGQKQKGISVLRSGVKGVQAVIRARKMARDNKAMADPLLDGDVEAGHSHVHHKTAEETKAEEQVEKMKSTLETVQKFVPTEQKLSLRATEAYIMKLMSAIHGLEDLLDGVDPDKAVHTAAGLAVVIFLLLVFQDWQKCLIQVAMSGAVCGVLYSASPLSRIVFAIQCQLKNPEIHKMALHCEALEDISLAETPALENGNGVGPTLSETAAPSKSAEKKEEEGRVVAVSMSIENVDFNKLSEASKAELRSGLQQSIARQAGVEPSDVSVALSAGSVKVDCKISTTANIQRQVQGDALSSKVLQTAKSIEGVARAASGAISVTAPVVTVEVDPKHAVVSAAAERVLKAATMRRSSHTLTEQDCAALALGGERTEKSEAGAKRQKEVKSGTAGAGWMSSFQCCSRYIPSQNKDPVLDADIPKRPPRLAEANKRAT